MIEQWKSMDESTRKKIVAGVLLVVAIAVIAVPFVGLGGSNEAPAATSPPETMEGDGTPKTEPGFSAPDASFTAVNGTTYNISQFKGQQLMIWFPGATCPPCQEQVRWLGENKTAVQNMTILVLPPQSDPDEIVTFADQYAPSTLNESNWIWGTPSQYMEDTYNSERLFGLSYLVDSSGTIRRKGTRPANDLTYLRAFADHPEMLTG